MTEADRRRFYLYMLLSGRTPPRRCAPSALPASCGSASTGSTNQRLAELFSLQAAAYLAPEAR
jgi:hypothetical protein